MSRSTQPSTLCADNSNLQADSKVKYASWLTSRRPPGADRLTLRGPKVNSCIWFCAADDSTIILCIIIIIIIWVTASLSKCQDMMLRQAQPLHWMAYTTWQTSITSTYTAPTIYSDMIPHIFFQWANKIRVDTCLHSRRTVFSVWRAFDCEKRSWTDGIARRKPLTMAVTALSTLLLC